MENLKLETIQLPMPEDDQEKQEVEETVQELSEPIKESRFQRIKDLYKTNDIYGGNKYESMVAAFGRRKTLKYLKANQSLYGMTKEEWRKTKRDVRNAKYNISRSEREQRKKNLEELNKVIKEIAEDWAKEKSQKNKAFVEKKFALIDKGADKLKGFTANRKKQLQGWVETINNIDSPNDLKKTVHKFFMEEVNSIEKPKFIKRANDLLKPVEEEIMPWYNAIMTLYDTASSVSLDTIIDVMKMTVLVQFYPFIAKYKQYKAITDDLASLKTEMQLVLDAIKRKAEEYGDEAGIPIPPLPPIPDLPTLPDLPI